VKRCCHRLVIASWIDADEEGGWSHYKEKPSWIIHTVGFVVATPRKKTDFLVLANSHLPDTDSWSGLSRIPKGMLLSVETIRKNVHCGEFYDSNTGNP
jgi:hypothetical protein